MLMRGRHLMPPAEMMLDQKRAVIPRRFSLDVEVDEIMEALPRHRAGCWPGHHQKCRFALL